MAVEPVVYGASERPPRGDYSRAREDYTCPQNWSAYTDADHDTYRRLYERQSALLPGLAAQAFIDALPSLGVRDRIPRFDEINERLRPATGWEIVAVPGLIPERPFFDLLAHRRFPVTDWIRTPEEFDYIVEPDVFHDLFGHVPLLFNPVFADYVQRYGQGGLKAHDLGAGEPQGLRAYGAGILSSSGELRHSVTSRRAQRIALDLVRCMRTRYKIDDYQATYFVIDSFEQLFEMTAPDFTPIYETVRSLGELPADASIASDSPITLG
jgi:phenylalanine-4-hydroxylase